jgi:hypothetical protein
LACIASPEKLPGVPKWVVGDRCYTSHAFREPIWDMGARPGGVASSVIGRSRASAVPLSRFVRHGKPEAVCE